MEQIMQMLQSLSPEELMQIKQALDQMIGQGQEQGGMMGGDMMGGGEPPPEIMEALIKQQMGRGGRR